MVGCCRHVVHFYGGQQKKVSEQISKQDFWTVQLVTFRSAVMEMCDRKGLRKEFIFNGFTSSVKTWLHINIKTLNCLFLFSWDICCVCECAGWGGGFLQAPMCPSDTQELVVYSLFLCEPQCFHLSTRHSELFALPRFLSMWLCSSLLLLVVSKLLVVALCFHSTVCCERTFPLLLLSLITYTSTEGS